MPTWLETIEAEANERLPLPPGRQPGQELARYRSFLKTETNRLRALHREGGGGRQVCHARAALLDILLRHLFQAVLDNPPAGFDPVRSGITLVAVGGYGRGELNPHSDVDILFLHNVDRGTADPAQDSPHLTAITNGLLYPLWDIGLKIGHAVRTIEECVAIANSDMHAKTSLIEARHIAGNIEPFAQLQAAVLHRCVRGFEDQYIAARLQAQESRRAKHGGSACMQEPNIKNGCGGLRDYQNLLWMGFFKYQTRTLEDLENRGLLSAKERAALDTAHDFLLRVRNDLHYETNRATDALTRSIQPRIAANLGYTDRSPVRRIESFMRHLYTHLRTIHLLSRTLEQRLTLSPPSARPVLSIRDLLRRGRRRFSQQIVDGFRMVDGQIHAVSNHVFRDQPRRLLLVFLHAQQRNLHLHPDLEQLIRNELDRVDRAFRRDRHTHETFLEILNQRGAVAPILRAMHDVGLLGRYLPEFGRLTCLVQHEFYHQYTADEHTLACIEHLDRIPASTQPPHSNYTNLFHSVERPFILYLALLLHDVGKARRGKGKGHSESGARTALVVSRRLGLDGATAHTLRLIIEHHLLMATVSQRRDLDDPAVIRQFAAQVQSLENLKLLTLHTLADSLGTSDKLWNGFKDLLLTQLYRRTRALLTGTAPFIQAATTERLLLLADLRRQLPPSVSSEELHAHLDKLPPRYFQIHSARDIIDDLLLVHSFLRRRLDDNRHPLAPAILSRNEPARGYTLVKICARDRLGLFTLISGALTAAGLNILSAQIFTRSDGIILDTFCVTDAQTGLPAEEESRTQFESILEQALTRQIDIDPLIERRKPAPPIQLPPGAERIPTTIHFDNASSDTRTILDLESEDHVGLLHAVARTLAQCDIDISLAKICTENGAAIDSFYIAEPDGRKIISPQRQAEIQHALNTAIQRLAHN